MELPAERVGPWVRAISAGLRALAPGEDWVPLEEARAHLHALDPEVGGDLIGPAEFDESTGLPAFPWLERARAEQVVAGGGGRGAREAEVLDRLDPGDDRIEAAARLDADLARRLAVRRALHRFLRRVRLLPASRLTGALRRLEPTTDLVLAYDRLLPSTGWMRLRADLSGPRGWHGDLLRVRRDGGLDLDPGLQHLLARHCPLPIALLHEWLGSTLVARVVRLSRSVVGPFWFPGGPTGVPDPLRGGLVLHVSTEVLGADVRASGHRDPWVAPPKGEAVPPGCHLFRERRFAASPLILPAVREWARSRGTEVAVVPLVPEGSPGPPSARAEPRGGTSRGG